MLAAGEWRPKSEPASEYDWTPPASSGPVVSFHLPSWYSPWVRWGDVLARFFEAPPVRVALYGDAARAVYRARFSQAFECHT